MKATWQRELLRAAYAVRQNAYAPYSLYRVGAAVLADDGRIYTGCNMENVAFSPSLCAERAALAAAVSAGERRFLAIAVVGGKGDTPDNVCLPCGVCRQVMAEFFPPEAEVLTGTEDAPVVHTVGELLPHTFGKSGELSGEKRE